MPYRTSGQAVQAAYHRATRRHEADLRYGLFLWKKRLDEIRRMRREAPTAEQTILRQVETVYQTLITQRLKNLNDH